MVVDDDPYILITIREIFEPLGFSVFTVNDGKTCISELKNGFRGVILMDIMMPIMNGWETLREIVKQDLVNDNIISIVTAKDEPDPDIHEFKDYIRDYITKPFEPDEIVQIVNSYLEN